MPSRNRDGRRPARPPGDRASARQPGGRGSRRPSRFLTPVLPADLVEGAGASAPKSKRRGVAHCRECGKALSSAKQKKLGRCADCPASYDEELFESLREWRKARAEGDGVPAYVVFTDATLTALAEVRPTSERELLAVSGVGRSKLEKYGADVLALVAGEVVGEPAGAGADQDASDL
jgi:DNA helicase-2/ATP-dependent DNA helicase PcrA